MTIPFLACKAEASIGLPGLEQRGTTAHFWAQAELDALTAAMAAQRPLLVRGEPGSGKSQLARAAAKVLRGEAAEPFVQVIHPRFEAMELLYRFDAVQRLADAQVPGRIKEESAYVRRGALWQAIAACEADRPPPVMLIDEIDKADADVPNSLLEVLGNRGARCEYTGEEIRPASGRMPLVIITTNEERELPTAFVRRCVVLNLNPPKDQAGFKRWLRVRGDVHQDLQVAAEVRERAADLIWADRNEAARWGNFLPGLAEYIDLLVALDEVVAAQVLMAPREVADRDHLQLAWVNRLAGYFLRKHADQPQLGPLGGPVR